MSHLTTAADLDVRAAWHGDRADPRVLLADRPSGEHPLVRGGLLHGTGATESLSKAMLGTDNRGQRARPTGRRQVLHVTNKAMARGRDKPTRTTPNTRLYAYWTAAEKRQHSERMREYYAGRKQALAQARREKQRAQRES